MNLSEFKDSTPGPWNVSKHAVPPGMYQAGIHAEDSMNDLAIVRTSAQDANLIAAAPSLLDLARMGVELAEQRLEEWEGDGKNSDRKEPSSVVASRLLREKAVNL